MINPVWYHLKGCACDSVRWEGFFHIPAASPWFDGHFPNNPVLPGVAMLCMVQDLLRKSTPQVMVKGFSRVRFRHIVRDNANIHVRIVPKANHGTNRYLFEITGNACLICSGTVETDNPQQGEMGI